MHEFLIKTVRGLLFVVTVASFPFLLVAGYAFFHWTLDIPPELLKVCRGFSAIVGACAIAAALIQPE